VLRPYEGRTASEARPYKGNQDGDVKPPPQAMRSEVCQRVGGNLTQACRRIGARRKRLNRCARAVVRRDFSGGRLRKAHSNIPVQMIFGAGRAISLARILIALAGKLVTAADAITIAGFGSRFDGNKSHGVSPSKHSMRDSAGRRGCVTRRSTRCDQEKWARLFPVHWFCRARLSISEVFQVGQAKGRAQVVP
jgi:hypothetical protein